MTNINGGFLPPTNWDDGSLTSDEVFGYNSKHFQVQQRCRLQQPILYCFLCCHSTWGFLRDFNWWDTSNVGKTTPGTPPGIPRHYKLGFFSSDFLRIVPWWTTIKSPLGSIFLEHVPSILSRSQVNESLEEEFPLQIDREFWCPCCLVLVSGVVLPLLP